MVLDDEIVLTELVYDSGELWDGANVYGLSISSMSDPLIMNQV